MYQPHPGGSQIPEVQRPPAPPSVLNAVKLMYAGAALDIISLIIGLLDPVSKNARSEVGSSIVAGLVGAGIWILIARASKAGKNSARITGTVLFGISIAFIPIELTAHTDSGTLNWIVAVISWLVGLSTVILFWQRSSSAFFRPQRPSGPPNGTPLWRTRRTGSRYRRMVEPRGRPNTRRTANTHSPHTTTPARTGTVHPVATENTN